MKRVFYVAIVLLAVVGFVSCGEPKPYKMVDGTIICHTPERPAGQQDMLQFAAEPLDTVRVGFIGLGSRGKGGPKRWSQIEGTKIVALCDLKQECIDRAQEYLDKAGRPRAAEYTDSEEAWKQVCERDDIDLIYVATPWASHVEMALYAMECGKHVAVEVPAAFTMEELWQIIDTSERTRKHCMMLENCIYDFFELTTMNMAHQGVFGEILHAEGAYIHNLGPYWEGSYKNWRVKFNMSNRGDLYPTHGFGPICMALNIHRGNKLNYLVSMDTKPANSAEVGKKYGGFEECKSGDHTVTLIKTEKEQTVEVHYNVYSPRPYSRMYQLTGTKGFANKYPVSGYTFTDGSLKEGVLPEGTKLDEHGFASQEVMAAAMEAYKHPIHREIEEQAKKVGGHGGMDFVMDYRLIYCLHNGLPLDQDVYDAAEWSSLISLSAVSLEHGSMPVAIPDFTRGDWNKLQGVTFYTK